MDPDGSIYNPLDLEGMLNDKRAKPRYLRISLLESITNNFSDDLVLGRGGFAVVYQGLLQNGVVAVKKLTQKLDVHEERFREEVDCLMRVKHKNIVRFLGYCSDTQGKFWELNGKTVIAEERQRFLCFEYLPGSLDKYMKEQPREHEWTTCYQIIKGVCEGLHYLHDQKIVHRDLKPANILLDHDMVPKIADFGLSKRFDKDQTHAITSNLIGSPGYMAPEFFGGLITFKSDIYSLGIIMIEILSGNKGYPDIDNVLESWRIKFEISPGDAQLEPVRVCTEIAIECTDFNPAKRPDTWRILERLHEMEGTYGVFEMADKAPYSVQGITSAVPMGPGSTSTESIMLPDGREVAIGSDKAVAKLFDSISKDVVMEPESPLDAVHRQVNAYCRKPWKMWRANIIRNCFRSPTSFHFVVASIIFVSTIVQAIYAILSFLRGQDKSSTT